MDLLPQLKAVTGLAAVPAGKELGEALVGFIAWLVSLAGVAIPDDVQGYLVLIVMALVSYAGVWLVPNISNEK